MPVIYLRTRLPKYTDEYVAIFEAPKGKEIVRFTSSVGNYFTEAGEFAEVALMTDVAAILSPVVDAYRGSTSEAKKTN